MKSRLVRALLVCAAFAAVFAVDTLRAASSTIVISEFRVRGPNGAADEFIELFNGSPSAVDISGWKINGSNNAAGVTTRATIPANTTLGAGCYYLLTNSSASGGPYSGSVPGNLTFATGITDDGGIGLLNAANVVIDQVGMSTGSAYKEGTPLASLGSSNVSRGYERKPGQDTDDNSADFQLLTPSSPQNAAPGCLGGPAATNPSGTMTASPTSVRIGDSITFTVTVTPGTNPTSTGIAVTGNLVALGLGTPAFISQGGNLFTFTGTIPAGVSGGSKSVTATITDTNSPPRSATTSPATQVTVLSPSDPTISSATANPSSVAPGDSTTLTVTVTPGANPGSTGVRVNGDLTAIGGNALTQFQGSGTTFTFSAIVGQGTSAGVKTLPVTVSDLEGRSTTSNLTLTVASAPQPATHLVISQVYGTGGNNSTAAFDKDFVELYNPTATTVNVNNWSVQYSSATGSSWGNATGKTSLVGTIGPGEYYLVALASGGTFGAALPDANVTGPTNLSGTSGKVALVDDSTSLSGNCPAGGHIVDFVGYGTTADCKEGAAGTATAPPDGSGAIVRKLAGATDTDDNKNDFAVGPANPRRTAPIVTLEVGPSVTNKVPGNTATNVEHDPTFEIDFSEPVTFDPGWLTFACPSGSHLSYSDATATNGKNHFITPNDAFASNEVCTATIHKDLVHDVDTDDSADTDTLAADITWTFTITGDEHLLFTPDVHLTMGNPTGAVTDVSLPANYLMSKPEFALSYNRDKGRPNWVSWHLTTDWFGSVSRPDDFRADPQVPAEWYRVESFDFSGSGFDRGHMTPNADRDSELPTVQATFLMSNMIAQAPDNNQGPWAALENDLRTIAGQGNELYIVSGPEGTGGTGSGGFKTEITNDRGRIEVPAWTWKAALILPAGGGDDLSRVTCTTPVIAVRMPNAQGIRNDDWHTFLVSVDTIETNNPGVNLFSNLPPAIQHCIEAGTYGVDGDHDRVPDGGDNCPADANADQADFDNDGIGDACTIKQEQSITFGPLAAHTFGDGDFAVSATASSHLAVDLIVVSGPATIASGVVHLTGVGTVTIRASQAGNPAYTPAADVERSFEVAKATPSFSGLTSATIEAGSAATTFSGTLAANGLVPPGSVVITAGGSSVTAPLGADGSFSASVPTASLAASATPYVVIYQYAGSSNFTGASGAGTLTVVDTTAPTLSGVTATPGLLGPPNHKMIDVSIGYTTSDLSGTPACTLSVSSNEAANAQGDGNTAIDWQVLDPHHVRLRAERAGGGSGRLYTVAIRCTDSFGNSSAGTATVSVSK